MSFNGIYVEKITDGKGMEKFISFPRKLYKGNSLYVPDMDTSVRDFFSPKKNSSLETAEAQLFLAYKDNQLVGRIAGIISKSSNKTWNTKTVRFSHIDFIDDENVSAALLDAVMQWGKEFGMESMEGPMGFTDFDKEGMLVEDFEVGGTFMDIWNPPYYVEHMKKHGFEKVVDWLHVFVEVPEKVPSRYARVAAYTREEFGLKVVRKSAKDILKRGYGKKIFQLLNDAYAPLFGFAPFTEKQADEFLNMYVPLLDLELVPLIENEKGELVCIAVTVADFSKAIYKSNGKMLPFGWFHLLKALKWDKHDKAQLMIIAVRPDMQGLGVNALIFDHLIPIYNKRGIRYCETGQQLETNVKELSQWKPLNPQLVKRRRCWGKAID